MVALKSLHRLCRVVTTIYVPDAHCYWLPPELLLRFKHFSGCALRFPFWSAIIGQSAKCTSLCACADVHAELKRSEGILRHMCSWTSHFAYGLLSPVHDNYEMIVSCAFNCVVQPGKDKALFAVPLGTLNAQHRKARIHGIGTKYYKSTKSSKLCQRSPYLTATANCC